MMYGVLYAPGDTRYLVPGTYQACTALVDLTTVPGYLVVINFYVPGTVMPLQCVGGYGCLLTTWRTVDPKFAELRISGG